MVLSYDMSISPPSNEYFEQEISQDEADIYTFSASLLHALNRVSTLDIGDLGELDIQNCHRLLDFLGMGLPPRESPERSLLDIPAKEPSPFPELDLQPVAMKLPEFNNWNPNLDLPKKAALLLGNLNNYVGQVTTCWNGDRKNSPSISAPRDEVAIAK